MSTNNKGIRYDEDSKRTLVNLYRFGGKTHTTLCKEYRVSQTALTCWVKQYTTVQTDDGKVMTAFKRCLQKAKCAIRSHVPF